MTGKNLTYKKRSPVRKKSSVSKSSAAKRADRKIGVASVPTPPFSRFESTVIGGVLVCISISYALAYFSPVGTFHPGPAERPLSEAAAAGDQHPAYQHHQNDQSRYRHNHSSRTPVPLPDQTSLDTPADEVNFAVNSEKPHDQHRLQDSLETDTTHSRIRPIAREKSGHIPTEDSLIPHPGLSGASLRETAGHTTPAALIGETYSLDALRKRNTDVPRRFLEHFPTALTEIEPASRRKDEFFKIMLPLILRVNETIIDDRNRLLAFRDQTKRTPQSRKYQRDHTAISEQQWVYDLASRYGFKNPGEDLDIQALLKRVDTIPTSLALAQSAIESAWGSSRFAQEGNAAFGQWSFDPKGGLKPLDRAADKTHFVRRFSRLIEAVRSYAHNLNTHAAYRELRAQRARLRQQKGSFSGLDLVDGLRRYSQRGQSYVQDVRRLIKANHLTAYDSVKLAPERLARAK